MVESYKLAKQGVFWTVQGEGVMMGLPQIFIRLAGCSVGCEGCDTNYAPYETVALPTILDRVSQHLYGAARWAWITGGEPTDQDLDPLIGALRQRGLQVALATAGTRRVPRGTAWGGVDFLSVSPHGKPDAGWVQRCGDQLNLVPGLNGLRLSNWGDVIREHESDFSHLYVTPCAGKRETLEECLLWVRCRPKWRLGVQAHKVWGLP